MTARLQRELKKKHVFDSPQQVALIALLRTADRAQIELVRLFRDYGLTTSQYNILRILRGEAAPLPILEIASRTITVVPGITGLVVRLENAGLVLRTRCKADRRVVFISLTAKAAAVLKRLDAPLDKAHQRIMQRLPEADLKQLIAWLERIRCSLADPDDFETTADP